MYNIVFINTEICSIFNLDHSTVKIYQYLKFSYLSYNLTVSIVCDILGTDSEVTLKRRIRIIFAIVELLHKKTDTYTCTSAGFFLGGGLTILECPPSQKKRYSRLMKIVQPVPPFKYFNL